MLKGFKEFILRGNVLDLAVAVVIGTAFTAVVTAVVNGFINPLIAAIFGKEDLSHAMTFTIHNSQFSIGLILNAVINFLAVAAAVYFFIVVPVKAIMDRKKKGIPDPEVPPSETDLLTEIRDLLAKQAGSGTPPRA